MTVTLSPEQMRWIVEEARRARLARGDGIDGDEVLARLDQGDDALRSR